MKFPRLITRRRVKWACVVMIVGTTLILIASIGQRATIALRLSDGSGVAVVFVGGGLVFMDAEDADSVMSSIAGRWSFYRETVSARFKIFPAAIRPNTITYLFIPLWIPIVCLGGIAIWLHRTDSRRLPGHCRDCGYDLTGLKETAVCPECGGVVDHSNRGEASADRVGE